MKDLKGGILLLKSKDIFADFTLINLVNYHGINLLASTAPFLTAFFSATLTIF
jgi:hypothetical protein